MSTAVNRDATECRLLGVLVPVLVGVLVYAVLATGAWAYLLPNYLALTEQVKELETQVDRLAAEVTELESQVDRYAEENTKLEENMDEFENQNEQLRQSNALYSNLTRGLNGTVIELREQNEILDTSNEEYSGLNAELNQTNARIQEERLALEAAIDEIGNAVLQAAKSNQNLLDENLILEGLNGTLTSQIDTITGTIIDMDGEIKRLEELINELQTILSFLESAAEDVGESYEANRNWLGIFHMGKIKVGLSRAQLVCQCREVEIRLKKKKVPVQIDGEPWKQNPCTLRVRRKKEPALMLHRAAAEGGGVETEMAKLLDWAEERELIDRNVHATLMREFSRRIEGKARQRRFSSNDNAFFSMKR